MRACMRIWKTFSRGSVSGVNAAHKSSASGDADDSYSSNSDAVLQEDALKKMHYVADTLVRPFCFVLLCMYV